MDSLESDTFLHSWEMLARILKDESCRDILLDIGMPVRVRFSCGSHLFLHRPKADPSTKMYAITAASSASMDKFF